MLDEAAGPVSWRQIWWLASSGSNATGDEWWYKLSCCFVPWLNVGAECCFRSLSLEPMSVTHSDFPPWRGFVRPSLLPPSVAACMWVFLPSVLSVLLGWDQLTDLDMEECSISLLLEILALYYRFVWVGIHLSNQFCWWNVSRQCMSILFRVHHSSIVPMSCHRLHHLGHITLSSFLRSPVGSLPLWRRVPVKCCWCCLSSSSTSAALIHFYSSVLVCLTLVYQ